MKTFKVILLGLIQICILSCGHTPTTRETEEKRIADSIRVADSFAMVEYYNAKNAYEALPQSQKDSINRAVELQKLEARKNSTIGARKLFKAYEDNEVKADQDFGMKRFYIEGVISDIRKEGPGEVHIYLDINEDYRFVICVYKNEPMTAKFLSKGKRVTFLGTCTGFGTKRNSIFIDECELVDNIADIEN